MYQKYLLVDKSSCLENSSDVYCLFGSIQDLVLMTVEFAQGSQYNLLIVFKWSHWCRTLYSWSFNSLIVEIFALIDQYWQHGSEWLLWIRREKAHSKHLCKYSGQFLERLFDILTVNLSRVIGSTTIGRTWKCTNFSLVKRTQGS